MQQYPGHAQQEDKELACTENFTSLRPEPSMHTNSVESNDL